jgi:SAM-dependent methyltransferase
MPVAHIPLEASLTRLRDYARRATPPTIRRRIASKRLQKMRQRNSIRSAQDVFSEIYATGRWGSGASFDSGSGSVGAAPESYVGFVRDLIEESGARHAVDIGCGDLRVASGFIDLLDSYIGVDVVPELIDRNSAKFGRPGVSFVALDAAISDVPDGDVCFVRQVFQHLSNNEITSILQQCSKFPIVVVTEHWPAPELRTQPNQDKPHGPDTRLDFGSWVDIGEEPFQCGSAQMRLVVPADRPQHHAGETIRTVVWTPSPK